jgi:predicted enzyme related to lactoylglutathione lyase
MAKVTGIGGVFFKSTNDNAALTKWYSENLGISLESWGGAILKWGDDEQVDGGMTVWTTAAPDSKWFAPSESNFMVNYRVDDLDELVADLRSKGVEVLKEQADDSGKFAWVMDPDGNKVELWEPLAQEITTGAS